MGYKSGIISGTLAAEILGRKDKLNIWGDPELTKKYLRLKSKWGQQQLKNHQPGNSVSDDH
jgi:flavin-dependent dehydrogenase